MVEFIRKRRWKFQASCKSIKITHIIVKKQYQEKARQIFQRSKIKITTEDHRQLDSFIHTKVFIGSYINTLISKCCEELSQLSENV